MTRVLLDACVLYPTVMREVLLACAATSLFEPYWSPRIIAEWTRATAKLGPAAQVLAEGEAAALAIRFPSASVSPPAGAELRLWLPDPADVHVLAAAIAAHADMILTLNAVDFPRNLLAEQGLTRSDPDTFLMDLRDRHPGAVDAAVAQVVAEACRLSGQDWTARSLLKKARLYRMARVSG